MCDPCAKISIYDKKTLSFLNSLYPPEELVELTRHLFLKKIMQGPELRRLLLKVRGLSPLHRAHVFKTGSQTFLESSFAGTQVLEEFILGGKFTTDPAKFPYYHSYVDHLLKRKKFDVLVSLVRIDPVVFYSRCYFNFDFIWISRNLTIADSSYMMDFIMSANQDNYPYMKILCGILSAPIELASMNKLVDFFNSNCRADKIYGAIIKLCTWKFPELTADIRDKLYSQNIALFMYLDKCEQVNGDLLITFRSCAHVLNEIRFNEASLDQDLLEETMALINTSSAGNSSLANIVLTAVVYSQRRFLFDEIIKQQIRILNDNELENALIQYPEYARLFLGDNYLGSENDSDFMLAVTVAQWEASRNIHHNAEEICEFDGFWERLVLAAATCTAEEFNNLVVKLVNQGQSEELYDAFDELSVFLDNPVPPINIILSHLDLVEFPSVTLFRGYFEALLLDERNKNASLDALLAREILLDTDCVDALMSNCALATAFGSEQNRPIRERLRINLNYLINTRSWKSGHVLRLFEALHITIEDWSFSVEIDQGRIERFRTEFEFISWSDLASHAKELGFLSHLVLYMCKRSSITCQFDKSVESGSPNLLLFPCADVLEMWYQKNPKQLRSCISKWNYDAIVQCLGEPPSEAHMSDTTESDA